MRIKTIEIDDVSKIKEPIMDYAKNADKLYFSAKEKNYSINYTIENEEKALKLLKDSINLTKKELDYNKKEIKSYNRFLIVAIFYAMLFVGLSFVVTSFIPLIFTAPSLIFGTRSFNNLKELKEENKKLDYDLYIQDLNYECRKIDLNTNRSIEAQKQIREQEIQSIENQVKELNNRFDKQRSNQKVLSLK